MLNFIDTSDGSGRPLRDVQKIILDWLYNNWNNSRVFAIGASVGSGKSLIARTVQRAIGDSTRIVVPSNILLDQYVSEYDINCVKGREHYTSPDGISCAINCPILLRTKACEGCPYQIARSRARRGEPTIFNPVSLMHFIKPEDAPQVTIVDEAHTLGGFLQQISSVSLSKVKYGWTNQDLSELNFVKWVRGLIGKLEAHLSISRAKTKSQIKERLETVRHLEQLTILVENFELEPENYALWVEPHMLRGKRDELLHVQSIRPPKNLCRKILGSGKVILMSGTLFDMDIQDMIGTERYLHLDAPNPIDKSRRPIEFRPISDNVNCQTPISVIANSIDKLVESNPGVSTLVHVTYADSVKLKDELRTPALYNTKVNKDKTLKQFKDEGGVFIASGCAEGLDLKDDLCRLIYIPRLHKPNKGDEVVKKRLAQPNGQEWYDMTTLKTTLQQIGRGCRHENDYAKTIIGDPMFARLISRYGKRLPRSFTDSISWG